MTTVTGRRTKLLRREFESLIIGLGYLFALCHVVGVSEKRHEHTWLARYIRPEVPRVAGGGHSLHVVCDLTLASREHAKFKQTDADVASFDGGYGSAYLARQIGQKFAREIFFLGREYSADEAHRMGMVNEVVAHEDLEKVALQWAADINAKSPTAQRMLKFAFNLVDDGLVGQQLFAGEATRLAYGTDEAVEGRNSFLEKRDPDWSAFPWMF